MAKKEMDPMELAEQKAKESGYSFTHKMRTPFEYDGNTYEELVFDWGKLTGRDALAIENELQSTGKAVVIPALSGEYLIRMCAKACTLNVGYDIFEAMPLYDYNAIRSAARSFLLKSEL